MFDNILETPFGIWFETCLETNTLVDFSAILQMETTSAASNLYITALLQRTCVLDPLVTEAFQTWQLLLKERTGFQREQYFFS